MLSSFPIGVSSLRSHLDHLEGLVPMLCVEWDRPDGLFDGLLID